LGGWRDQVGAALMFRGEAVKVDVGGGGGGGGVGGGRGGGWGGGGPGGGRGGWGGGWGVGTLAWSLVSIDNGEPCTHYDRCC